MAQLQIETKINGNQIWIQIKYPLNPQIAYNFTLMITIYEQNISQKKEYEVYKKQFNFQQKLIIIKDIKYLTMYKINICNRYGGINNIKFKQKNLFISTQINNHQNNVLFEKNQDLQRNFYQGKYGEKQFVKMEKNQKNDNGKLGKSQVKKKINHSNNQFCNSELLIKTLAKCNHIQNDNKVERYLLAGRKCRNLKQFLNKQQGQRQNTKQLINKGMLVTQSKLLFADIYKYREGYTFFENDWFMGPFYSYDKNEEQAQL